MAGPGWGEEVPGLLLVLGSIKKRETDTDRATERVMMMVGPGTGMAPHGEGAIYARQEKRYSQRRRETRSQMKFDGEAVAGSTNSARDPVG